MGRHRRKKPAEEGTLHRTVDGSRQLARVNGRREMRQRVRRQPGRRAAVLTVPLPRLLATATAHLVPQPVTSRGRTAQATAVRRLVLNRKEPPPNLRADQTSTNG